MCRLIWNPIFLDHERNNIRLPSNAKCIECIFLYEKKSTQRHCGLEINFLKKNVVNSTHIKFYHLAVPDSAGVEDSIRSKYLELIQLRHCSINFDKLYFYYFHQIGLKIFEFRFVGLFIFFFFKGLIESGSEGLDILRIGLSWFFLLGSQSRSSGTYLKNCKIRPWYSVRNMTIFVIIVRELL